MIGRRVWFIVLLFVSLVPAPAAGFSRAAPPQAAPGDTSSLGAPGDIPADLLGALAPYLQAHERPPIVLVHGWQGMNFDKPDCERPTDPAWGDANWGRLDEELEALGFHIDFALLKSGSSFDEPNCTPVAEENAPYVAEAIDLALASTGQDKVILIAHSMGGLVSRAYLESDLYRGDVVALITLGSPHVGVPVEVLAELVEILTFGALTLEDYCVAQPVVCQFSDNEAANPPGFSGIETFNNVHDTRAKGVGYHLIGGDIGFDHRAWIAEILYWLIPGPNDGIVPLPSAMGVSSADDGGGPPLPLLGPLSGVIDRLEVYAAHVDSFCDDPSVPFTCEYHYNYHDYDRFCADWDFSVYLDEEFRSSTFFDCLEPALNNRLPEHICGVASDLSLLGGGPPAVSGAGVRAWLPAETGTLSPGQEARRSFHLEGGPTMLFAHGPLQAQMGELAVTLFAPDGRVVDPAYAAAHPDEVRYKGDDRAGLYILLDAAPGTWQLVVQATSASPAGLAYRSAGLLLGGVEEAVSPGPAFEPGALEVTPRPLATPPLIEPDVHDSPHACTIDNAGPYLPGDTVNLSFQLQLLDEGNYVEWLDYYFVDGPNGWNVLGQNTPPDDAGGWDRTVIAEGCNSTGLAYWGIEDPVLAPVADTCDLGVVNLPLAGSFNGPWLQYEWFDYTPVESFEGSFPPPGWAVYKTGGGDDNHGFQQTSARAHTGSYSAYHDDDDPWFWDPIETWFVMPAHLVQAGDILAFWQNENYYDYYSYHGVWVSTGSPDPNDDDYIEGIELGPGPEDTWEEVWLDVDFFSGKTVYFAFKYEGDYSDEWYLDDVSIKRRRIKPTTYDFDLAYVVDNDPTYSCPGSPYVGVTSWYSDTQAGLAGVAMGDLVENSVNVATCGVSQPCPLPTIQLTGTVGLDGVCPGVPYMEVPENAQDVTFCFEVKNTGVATVTEHTLDVPALGGTLFSGTVHLAPGESYLFQQDWNFAGGEGECFPVTSTWTAVTPAGFGQPQGQDADVPFITTTYFAQDVGAAQVCIVAPLLVDFDSASYSVAEGDWAALITVTLSAVSPRPVTVDYASYDGTATAGDDYLPISGTLAFAPGVTSQSFELNILDDPLDEDDETVVLALSNAENADVGGNSPAALIIVDDDPLPTVDLYPAYVVNEAAGTAVITVTLNTPSGRLVTVDYATSDDTATAGRDYLTASGTLTFPPGVTQQSFAVTILDDVLDENKETVTLTLSAANNADIGGHNPALLNILDDDPLPTVEYSSASFSVDEGGGVATVTVILDPGSGRIVTVNYTTSDGTATEGEDYLAASGTLTFTPDVVTQTFLVVILDDTLPEGDETITLMLWGAENADIGGNNPATLTILDDEAIPTVEFSSVAYSVDEGAGTAVITVTLDRTSAMLVTVDYATSDGTATAGLDYLPASGTLTFEPGVTSQTFAVTILGDAILEGDETVLLTLSNAENADIGGNNPATLTIVEGHSFVIYLPLVLRGYVPEG